jgi:hypothetical protein
VEYYFVAQELISIVYKFCGEKLPSLQPWQKNVITGPKFQAFQFGIRDPLQESLLIFF